MNKVAIIIVVFNISNLIAKQIELLTRFCKDDNFDIIVVDNSNKPHIASEIRRRVEKFGYIYDKTDAGTADFSQSHAGACNYAYQKFQSNYDYIFLLDHDNFPTTKFSVKDTLGDLIIGGIAQPKPTKTYFWPGCLMINNSKIEKALVDFSISSEFGLDTGGQLYKIIDKYGIEQCHNFDEYQIDTSDGSGYSMICNQKSSLSTFVFMHFRNASNWSNQINNDQRITNLLSELHNYVYNKAYVRN